MAPPYNESRSKAELGFIAVFIPSVISFYLIYKYPLWFSDSPETFYLFGKQPAFWYSFLYTLIVSAICITVLIKGKNLYSVKKNPGSLNTYQRGKFSLILFSQSVVFFLIPFVIVPLLQGVDFWHDEVKIPVKTAHVYLWPAFTSIGVAVYIFGIITVVVYFFGKRYCSWFCSCGNLAETIGVTPWGRKWVMKYTPRGKKETKLEIIQTVMMLLAIITGIILLSDTLKLFSVSSVTEATLTFQYLVTDLIFGSVIGIGAYPFLGTRIWCRYGCPLAAWMHWLGPRIKTRFKVEANKNCRGIGLCTKSCPMGIDVESFAHRNKKPIMGSFGLEETPCIGCGGCISACPTQALHFKKPF